MAAAAITHGINTYLLPFSFIGLPFALLAASGKLSTSKFSNFWARSKVITSNPGFQLVSVLLRSFQLITIIHVQRHSTVRRELDIFTKISLYGFAMQAFPARSLWTVGEILVRFACGDGEVDERWLLSAIESKSKECLELGLLLILFALEFGREKGLPIVGALINTVIDGLDSEDALEKGVKRIKEQQEVEN
jgi:hypothetical protein